jgi:hypothetical protein
LSFEFSFCIIFFVFLGYFSLIIGIVDFMN